MNWESFLNTMTEKHVADRQTRDQSSEEHDHDAETFDMRGTQSEQLSMLGIGNTVGTIERNLEEVRTSPLFAPAVFQEVKAHWQGKDIYPAFGLFAGNLDLPSKSKADPQTGGDSKAQLDESFDDEVAPHQETEHEEPSKEMISGYIPPSQRKEGAEERPQTVAEEVATDFCHDPRIFLNVNAPWSAFICGSQGSGKSHSLACMLENCLIPDIDVGQLPQPLCGLVLHYDSFISTFSAQACEAAYLATTGVPVRVLVSPTNLPWMKQQYSKVDSRIDVRPLAINASNLTTENLLTLMAVDTNSNGPTPLYVHTATKTLREMALAQIRRNNKTTSINLPEFKNIMENERLSPDQRRFFDQRMELVESFVEQGTISTSDRISWTPKPGQLTIIDLSCPFVDADTACSLFNICLGIFLSQDNGIGRIIALDEAHKFMTTSTGASKLTETLKSVVRLQRHLACRVIIATQEPSISTSLLDLCAITVIHRFTSPNWFKTLRGHLAAVAEEISAEQRVKEDKCSDDDNDSDNEDDAADSLFAKIVKLNVGEALLCAPSALLTVSSDRESSGDRDKIGKRLRKAGANAIRVKVRQRISGDGGKSIMATAT